MGSRKIHLAQTRSYCPTLGPEREGLRQSSPSPWPQAGLGPPSCGLAAVTSSAVAFLRGTCPGPQALRSRPALGRVPSTAREAGSWWVLGAQAWLKELQQQCCKATCTRRQLCTMLVHSHGQKHCHPSAVQAVLCAAQLKCRIWPICRQVGAGERPKHQPVPLPSLPFDKTKSNESTIPHWLLGSNCAIICCSSHCCPIHQRTSYFTSGRLASSVPWDELWKKLLPYGSAKSQRIIMIKHSLTDWVFFTPEHTG